MWQEPENMWNDMCDYLDACADAPIKEVHLKVVSHALERPELDKPRMVSIKGFCAWAKISRRAYYDYKARDEYKDYIDIFESCIDAWNTEHAAAGMMNPAIVLSTIVLKNGVEEKPEEPNSNIIELPAKEEL